jgi:hypothetical protein
MENKQDAAKILVQAIHSSMDKYVEENQRNYDKPPSNKPEQKYRVGEEVDVQSWGGVTRAFVTGVEWVFHNRLSEWTWGYSVDRSVGLNFQYVPEGYLRKV